jgi:hypothetical protein
MNAGMISLFLSMSANLKIGWRKEIFQVDAG